MLVDRGQKVDTKMLEANIKLQDKIKDLEYDILKSNKKLKDIKKFCEAIDETFPECKSFASRIIFMIDKDEYE